MIAGIFQATTVVTPAVSVPTFGNFADYLQVPSYRTKPVYKLFSFNMS